MNSSKWDYPGMEICAKRLDALRNESLANTQHMEKAMQELQTGVQAQTGQAFMGAYYEHVSSIELFHKALEDEAALLRSNATQMQQADEDIAAEVRRIFCK